MNKLTDREKLLMTVFVGVLMTAYLVHAIVFEPMPLFIKIILYLSAAFSFLITIIAVNKFKTLLRRGLHNE